jgi:hypothetical protein
MSFHWKQLSEQPFLNICQEQLFIMFKPVQIKEAFRKAMLSKSPQLIWEKSSILPLISADATDDLAQNASGLLNINLRGYPGVADQFCIINVLILGFLFCEDNFSLCKRDTISKAQFIALKSTLDELIEQFRTLLSQNVNVSKIETFSRFQQLVNQIAFKFTFSELSQDDLNSKSHEELN